MRTINKHNDKQIQTEFDNIYKLINDLTLSVEKYSQLLDKLQTLVNKLKEQSK